MTAVAALLSMLLGGLPPAPAYVDPGTGSFLLQLLLGSLFGALLTVKLYWRRLKASVLRLVRRDGGSPDDR